MSLITPERAADLLALLPDKDATFVDIGEQLGGIYLSFGATYEQLDIRKVAVLDEHETYADHRAAWEVLASAADALRTVQHLYGLLEQHGIQAEAGA